MAVRNFWIDASIDGRKTDLSGGPASKEGGMDVTIKQRSKGGIVTAYRIHCYECVGELVTKVYDTNGELICRHVTER